MKSRIIEVTNVECGGLNWGKFMVLQYNRNDEWHHVSEVSHRPLLRDCGWVEPLIWVLDLQTGEGALFRPGGFAKADLDKHRVWVCPMFEPFLEWLYTQPLPLDLERLPGLVKINDPKSALSGYRRKGKVNA